MIYFRRLVDLVRDLVALTTERAPAPQATGVTVTPQGATITVTKRRITMRGAEYVVTGE